MSETATTAPRPKRPRPSINPDNAFFWEGCLQHEVRVQIFDDGTCVYPPMVRNPRTGETVSVAAKHVPFFKTGKELRDRLNRHKPDTQSDE